MKPAEKCGLSETRQLKECKSVLNLICDTGSWSCTKKKRNILKLSKHVITHSCTVSCRVNIRQQMVGMLMIAILLESICAKKDLDPGYLSLTSTGWFAAAPLDWFLADWQNGGAWNRRDISDTNTRTTEDVCSCLRNVSDDKTAQKDVQVYFSMQQAGLERSTSMYTSCVCSSNPFHHPITRPTLDESVCSICILTAFDDPLSVKSLFSAWQPCFKKGCLNLSRRGVKYKVFINNSYSTSRSSEVEEVNGFSGTLKNVSMSVNARWSRLQMSFVAVKLFNVLMALALYGLHTQYKAWLYMTHTSYILSLAVVWSRLICASNVYHYIEVTEPSIHFSERLKTWWHL